MAQQLQRQIDELQKAQRARRRPRAIEDEHLIDEQAESAMDVAAPAQVSTAAATSPENDMSLTPEQRGKKIARQRVRRRLQKKQQSKAGPRKSKTTRMKKARPASTRASGARQPKQYALLGSIPEALRNPSAARSILESIEKRGTATTNDVRADHPKFPDPTIRFYLGKFQREKIVRVALTRRA